MSTSLTAILADGPLIGREPQGYSSWADVMQATADGRSLNELFNEFQAVAAAANEGQQRFIDLLTYRTASPVVSVLQTLGSASAFEESSEYGTPRSSRVSPTVLNMGATLKDYDARWSATWKYLRDATAAEVQANANAIVESDKDLVFNRVMGTIFNNANRTVTDSSTDATYTVYAFANGDGWVPPTYAGNTFDGTHTHFRSSGAATVDSGDLDEIITDFKLHGYSAENGSQIVVFVNKQQGDTINGFRVGSGDAEDFVPAAGARFFTPDHLVGTQPSGTFAGFPVKGAYGEALIIESSRIPAGYLVGLASGGANLPSNPIMMREHPRMRGLQLIPGNRSDYPLVDSFWQRSFGTGVRHRLAGQVVQIGTGASYTAPTLYSA